MRDFDEPPLRGLDDTNPLLSLRPEPSRGPWIAGAVVLILLLAAGGLWLWRGRPAAEPVIGAPPAPAAEGGAGRASATPAPPGEPPLGDLPPLDGSDPFVRELAAALTSSPRLAEWLLPEHLVRRFVASVDNVAEGVSPAPHLGHLRPDEPFRVHQVGGRRVADPASHRRYEMPTELFVSLDGERVARLYRHLHPLFEEAYRELGYPGRTFDQTLGAAIDRLLSVELPAEPAELVPSATVWAYADPELEARPAAEKLLLRLGPENARRVQAKLVELRAALGLPTSAATE